MNKKRGQKKNLLVKILLLVVVFVTVFSGVNQIVTSTGKESLVRIISMNFASTMQVLYAVMGVCCLVTAVVLAIKLLKK
jgi:hypothetical protein